MTRSFFNAHFAANADSWFECTTLGQLNDAAFALLAEHNAIVNVAAELLTALKSVRPQIKQDHDRGGGLFTTQQLDACDAAIAIYSRIR